MKSIKLAGTITVSLIIAILLTSCSYFSAERPRFGGGELLDDERISDIKAEIFSDVESASSSQQDDQNNKETQDNNDINTNAEKDPTNSEMTTDTGNANNHESVDENNSQEEDEHSVVYWTEGGSVWHVSKECGSLKNSKNIISGSKEEAQEEGKERPCSRCDKD